MNKKEFYNKLNGNENMKAVIYVASSYPTTIGMKECNNQVTVCENFINKHINVSLCEKLYIDSSVGVRVLAARKPWIDFRARIDEGDIDVIIVSSFKEACCRLGGFFGMTVILNNNPAVIYSVQEDKIYDRELLNEMCNIVRCESKKSGYQPDDLMLYLYAKTEKDDLLWKIEKSGKFKVDFPEGSNL